MAQRHFKQLIKDMSGYSLNTFIGPLFTLLLTPIYTRVLEDASVYGVVDTLLMTGSIIYTIGLVNLHQAIMPLYHDSKEPQHQQHVIISAFLMLGLWITAIVGFVQLFAEPISRFIFDRSDLAYLLRLIALSQWFAVFYALCSSILRLRNQVKQTNILALSYVFCLAVTNLLFVVGLRWGARGVIMAQLSTYGVVALLGLYLIRFSPRLRPVPGLMKRLYWLGLPLMPAAFASWLLMYEDRFFLARMATYHDIGIYSIAIKLASMISVLLMAFKFAWLPLAMAIKNEPDAPVLYAKTLVYYAIGSFSVALGISLFSHEILLIFTTPEYLQAQRYVWLIAWMSIADGFNIVVTTGLYVTQKLGSQAWIVAVAAVVNTVLNIVLIPQFGIGGAAIATAVAYMVVPLLTTYKAQQLYPLAYDWPKVLVLGAAYLVLAGAGATLEPSVSIASLALRAGLCGIFGLLVFSNVITTASERQFARRLLRQPRSALRSLLRKA